MLKKSMKVNRFGAVIEFFDFYSLANTVSIKYLSNIKN